MVFFTELCLIIRAVICKKRTNNYIYVNNCNSLFSRNAFSNNFLTKINWLSHSLQYVNKQNI